MQYLITSEEMKSCDRNTSEYYGVPSIVLMERAALAVAARISEWRDSHNTTRAYNVLVVCGNGGNGGDGIAIARILHQHGYRVQIALISGEESSNPDVEAQKKSARAYKVPMDIFSKVRATKSHMEWDIIVDAVFGIGCNREVTGDAASALLYIDECKKLRDESTLVISVDMPSGINTDTGEICGVAVRADMTVTFNFAKMGQLLYPGTEYIGRLYVEDVGITMDGFMGKLPRYFFFDENPSDLLPRRVGSGNKGTFGKVLVIAGSQNMSGACVLCAGSALHAGAGMVKVITSEQNIDALRNNVPEAMYETYSSEEDDENLDRITHMLIENMNWSDTVVIGPGLGKSAVAAHILKIVLKRSIRSIVADADALNLISESHELRALASCYSQSTGKWLIMTPHIAEFARLYSAAFSGDGEDSVTAYQVKEHLLEWPQKLAEYFHCAILCKDARSVAAGAGREQMYVNVSGNSGMATAGAGDVLSGIIGALSARNMGGFQTACIGAYLHGIAGNKAASDFGEYYMTASDIMRELVYVMPHK